MTPSRGDTHRRRGIGLVAAVLIMGLAALVVGALGLHAASMYRDRGVTGLQRYSAVVTDSVVAWAMQNRPHLAAGPAQPADAPAPQTQPAEAGAQTRPADLAAASRPADGSAAPAEPAGVVRIDVAALVPKPYSASATATSREDGKGWRVNTMVTRGEASVSRQVDVE